MQQAAQLLQLHEDETSQRSHRRDPDTGRDGCRRRPKVRGRQKTATMASFSSLMRETTDRLQANQKYKAPK